jgi:proteasome-associated ATPase
MTQDSNSTLDEDPDTFIERVTSAAHILGVVLRQVGDRCLVACADGQIIEAASFPDARANSTVLLVQESRQIVKTSMALGLGPLAIVKSVDGSFCEISIQEETRRVINPLDELEAGCQVLLDATHSIAMRNLGIPKSEFQFESDTNISWSDIGGLAEAKKQMIQAIESPTRHAAIYKAYGQRRVKGILLYGASGCGKTMLGKAAANSIRKTHGGKGAETCFLYVKGPQILNMYVGNSESHVRNLFAQARKHYKTYGYPAIIFIDEADAVLRSRDGAHTRVSGMEGTIVPQFLSEMDGLEESGALVILSTNLPREIDAAIVREGRIDRKIKVPRPSAEEAVEIFRQHLKNRPVKGSLNGLVTLAAQELYSPSRAFYEVTMKDGKTVRVKLGELTNGGMIAGIVDKATELAIERDIKEQKSGTGISQEDLLQAIQEIDGQNRDINHDRDLEDILEVLKPQIEDIQKVRGDSYVSSSYKANGQEKVVN